MKITVSTGEILDKLTILLIKKEKILDKIKLDYISMEIDELYKEAKIIIEDIKYKKFINELYLINKDMWNINDNRKKMIKNNELGNEYVNLTVKESNLNDRRFQVKNKINKISQSFLQEQKSYDWV